MLTPVSADAPGHESVGTRKAASSSRSAVVKGPRKNLIGGATKCRACGPRAMPVVHVPNLSSSMRRSSVPFYPVGIAPCVSRSCGTARSTLPMEFASGCAAVKFWSIGRFGSLEHNYPSPLHPAAHLLHGASLPTINLGRVQKASPPRNQKRDHAHNAPQPHATDLRTTQTTQNPLIKEKPSN